MSVDRLKYTAFFITIVTAPALLAADFVSRGVPLSSDEAVPLAFWEQEYLFQALSNVNTECSGGVDGSVPAENVLVTAYINNDTSIAVVAGSPTNLLATGARFIRRDGSTITILEECDSQFVAPILAIIDSKQTPDKPVAVSTVDKPSKPEQIYHELEPKLSAYEQNFLGWTRDDNSVDSGYMDAQMSFKYRVGYLDERKKFAGFLAFTTRFSQYIETISSSPVVGKRYNPSLFGRMYLEDHQSFLDLGYAHDSNGQSITTEQAYLSEREKFAQSDGEPDFAKNYISRGWDYALFDWRQCWHGCENSGKGEHSDRFTTELGYKYFLDDGLLQGKPEEYNDWEGGSQKYRKQYDGLSLYGDYRISSRCFGVDNWGCGVRWEYTTGYDGIFDQSTNRIQFTIDDFWLIPSIGIWVQTGHNSSLANYYESVDSVGVAMVFSDPYASGENNK